MPAALQAVSLPPAGQGVTGDSFATAVSADGRFTVFTSTATNLVPGQVNDNGNQNVFLFDRQAGTTRLVNHLPSSATETGDGGLDADGFFSGNSSPPLSRQPVISADGHFVAFASFDDNLVANEVAAGTPTLSVYLYNVQTGSVLLVSHDPSSRATVGAPGSNPVLSGGGRFVAYAFDSSASFPNGGIALYDSATDQTTVLPGSTSGMPSNPTISDNGQFVAYLDQGQVFVYDHASGRTVLASHDNSSATSTTPANGASSAPVLSHDGSAVAFVSTATNLVTGQVASGFTNVFLYHNDTSGNDAVGSTRLVSGAGGSATTGGDGNSDSPAIDGDGSYVAYRSDADNLVNGTISGSNVYEFNARAGTQALVSHQAGQGSALTTSTGGASEPVIDDDGHLIAYASTAGNVVPNQSGPGGVQNIFVWLRQSDTNILVSGQGGSATATGNADSDGPLLARAAFPGFSSVATNLANGTGGTSVVYLNPLVQVIPVAGAPSGVGAPGFSQAMIMINNVPVAEIFLSPNTVFTGSPPGSPVGILSVSTILGGQFLPPGYALPPGEANNALFGLSGTALIALFQPSGSGAYTIRLHVNIGFGDDPVFLPVFAAAGLGNGHPLAALLVPVRLGKHKTVRLMVEVLDLVTGAVVEAVVSPFQAPKFRAITLVPLDLNGDGIPELIELLARRGKHTVAALLPA